MEKSYSGIGRTEWASVLVRNGIVEELSFGGDSLVMPSNHHADRKAPIAEFLFCLRNTFQIIIIYDRKEFCAMLEEIKEKDKEIYYIGNILLKKHDEDEKVMEENFKKFMSGDKEYF